MSINAKSTEGFGVRQLAAAFPTIVVNSTQDSWLFLAQVNRMPGLRRGRKKGGSKLPHSKRAGLKPGLYKIFWRTMREPGLMPKPLPLRRTPLGKTPLPLEGSGGGPEEPPPVTAMGGEPKATGAEGCEPMYCE
jgi:hypothetical protein